jgi:hypothetical protein
VDVLSSRILLRPSDTLGLAIYREFGPPEDPGVVFFLGPGLLFLNLGEGGTGGG